MTTVLLVTTMENRDLHENSLTVIAEPLVLARRKDRSCMLCHRRKVRCDKALPCSNCSRSDVLCMYPEPHKRPRHPYKSGVKDLLDRINRVERTITAWSSEQAAERVGQNQDVSPKVESLTRGMLLPDGDTSRYFNEYLLENILKEEEELRSVLGAHSADGPSSTLASQPPEPSLLSIGLTNFESGHIYSGIQYPTRWQALQLWQIFVNNVDPVLKILHIPSTQVIVYSTLSNRGSTPKNSEALLFAIYFAATTSLPAADAAHLLGTEKVNSLWGFRRGLEQALAVGNLLDSPSVTSLQALTLFLTCLRVYDSSRSEWALNGLAIRLAQSLGLHRDGKIFILPPFESEIRRRLWWHLSVPETRSMESHGIEAIGLGPLSDTCLPLNINDADLCPNMHTLPPPRAGWSEMSFSLLNAEMIRIFRQISDLSQASHTSSISFSSRDWKQNFFDKQVLHLEESYLSCCNEDIPIQRATAVSVRILIAKLDFKLSFKSHACASGPMYTEELLDQPCSFLEMNLNLQSDDLLRGFSWYFKTFTQYHALTYVLGYLCANPRDQRNERAWRIVEDSFRLIDDSDIPHESGSRWTILRILRGKALRLQKASSECNSLECHETALSGESMENFNNPIEGLMDPWSIDDYMAMIDWSYGSVGPFGCESTAL